jgi:divalent metal cation (Fe/Co/Zn/Cd) transporter
VLIGRAGWLIVSQAINVLVDRAVLEADAVRRVVQDVPGIQHVVRVRSRGTSDHIYLDLDVKVAAATTADHSEAIAREVRGRLRRQFSGLQDIQVYFVPDRDSPLDYALIARAEADALGLGVHEVISSTGQDGLSLDMHIEVSPEQSVGEAHRLVTQFEERLHQVIPDLARVVTHIEPAHTHADSQLYSSNAHGLAREAIGVARELYPANHWHDLGIRLEADGGYAISVHCHVDHDMAVEEAHRLAEVVETHIRARFPAIHRVTIHTEPRETA